LLTADSLVKNVRVKPAAMSVAVTYKSDKISNAKMRSHLHDLIQAASVVVVLKNSTSLSETEKEASWPGLQLSAVATTLAVLGGPLELPIPPLIVVLPIAIDTLPVIQRAWEGIRGERKLNIDFLDLMAIAITTFQGHFLTPSLMLSLIEVGENIRDHTARSSAKQTLDLLSSLGQFLLLLAIAIHP
jgi:P-type Cu2+ transporter